MFGGGGRRTIRASVLPVDGLERTGVWPSERDSREGQNVMAGFDPARVTKAEWIGLGAGVLAFVASFLPWWEVSFSGPAAGLGFVADGSLSAWSLGFFAWFPVLLLVASAGVMLAGHLGAQIPSVRVGWPVILLGVSVIALVIILLRWLTLPSPSGAFALTGVSYGAGFGLYVGLIAAVLFGLAQYLIFRASGQKFSDVTGQFRGPGIDPAPPSA